MEKRTYFDVKEFKNIKEIIYNSVELYGDNTAFVVKNKVDDKVSYNNISYNQLLEDINCLGSALYSMNMKNKRIAIIGKNRYEWVLSHLCNLMGSIISIPLDKELQLEELESSLIRSKSDAIIFDKKLLPIIETIKNRNNTIIEEYICMENYRDFLSIPSLIKKGKTLLCNGYTEYVDNKIDENAMNIILFTSGTTSQSKAVMLSHKNIASNIYALQCVEDIRSTDTNIAFLPFHHIFGSVCLLMMLSRGVKTAFPDGLKYVKQNMQEYKVSVFVAVPVLTEAMYKAIQKEIEKQGKTKLVKTITKISNFLLTLHIDIRRKLFKQILNSLGGSLRLIISGGAPADPYYTKGFKNIGIETIQGYGLSETSPVIAAENYKDRKIGSVGIPMNNVEVEIVDKNDDNIGELRVKGPSVMLGYYEMPDLTKEVLNDGWFYTGDLGYIDKKGFIFITGRKKNLIVLKNGKKVFPEELETLVNRIDIVNECMVFGLPDKNDNNDITVSVKIVYNEDLIKEKYSDLNEDDLRNIVWEEIKKVNTTFPRYKHIKKLYTSHTELIKTTTKKVRRQEEMKLILKEDI